MTPWSLARELYTRLGLPSPVIDGKARQLLLRRVMQRGGKGALSHDDGPRPGMVRRVSQALEELVLNGLTPGMVKGASRSERSKALALVHSDHLEALRGLGRVDVSELPGLVSEALKQGRDGLKWKAAGLYMLGDPPTAFRELYRAVMERCERTVVVEHASRREPTFVLPGTETRAVFNDPPSAFTIPPPGSGQRGVLRSERRLDGITGQDWGDELRRVARRVKALIIDGGVSPSSVAMMLPPDRKRDPWTYTVLREYGLPFDQGSRYRAIEVPTVRGLLDIFRSAEQGFPRELLLPALSLPQFGLTDDEGVRLTSGEMEHVTREAYVLGGGPDPVSSWTSPLRSLAGDGTKDTRLRRTASRLVGPLERLLKAVKGLMGGRRTVEAHLEGMLSIWEGLGAFEVLRSEDRSGRQLDGGKVASIALTCLLETVSAVRRDSVLTGTGEVPFKEALETLCSGLSGEWIDEGCGPGGVRVLAYEEGTGMAFDHLFILGLNEGSMPPRDEGFSLLSDPERRDLGLPASSKRREALERLCITIGSAEHPVISMHRTEGGSPVLPSPFIEAITLNELLDDGIPMSEPDLQRRFSELDDPLVPALSGAGDRTHPLLRDRTELLSRLGDRLGAHISSSSEGRARERMMMDAGTVGVIDDRELLTELGRRFGPEHVWSASRLETLRTCPYSFLVRYVMGVQELEAVEPGVAPEKLGTIFHSSAESFYSRWKGRDPGRVHPMEVEEAIAAMTSATLEVLGSYGHSGPYWDAVRERLLGDGRRPGMVQGFIGSEAGYRGAFRVARTELRFGMPGEAPGPPAVVLGDTDGGGETSTFLFRGSMDRLDTLEVGGQGAFFIWDYKTGSSEEDKKGLQVPLYLLAASKLLTGMLPAGGGYYYVRRPGAIRRDIRFGNDLWEARGPTMGMIAASAAPAQAAMREAMDKALDLIASARGGSFPPQENCKEGRCPYKDICRRGER